MRQKPPHMMSVAQRKMSSQEEINKRLSLPADLKLPDNFVEKLAVSPTLDGPLSRATRRQSLSEIGACLVAYWGTLKTGGLFFFRVESASIGLTGIDLHYCPSTPCLPGSLAERKLAEFAKQVSKILVPTSVRYRSGRFYRGFQIV